MNKHSKQGRQPILHFPKVKQTVGVLVAFAVCSIASAQQVRDVVWPVGEKMISGQITDVSPDGLTIVEKGKPRKLAVHEIEKLKLDDEPSGLSRIRDELENGQLEQAQRALDRLKPASRKLVKQDVEFYKAMIASRLALRGMPILQLPQRSRSGSSTAMRTASATTTPAK
jgi:hypothetical protein